MSDVQDDKRSLLMMLAVTTAGLALWAVAVAEIAVRRAPQEQLTLLVLVLLALVVGMFPITFPLPAGTKFTTEKVNFTLSDAFILLIAVHYGIFPAVMLAGLEGFVSSRSAVRRLSSNLYSSSMMAIAAAVAAAAMSATLVHLFGGSRSFTAVASTILIASLVQLAVNVGLLSTLLALRHGDPVLAAWRKNFTWAAAMFLPTSTAASLMYLAMQSGFVVVAVVGAPVLLTIYFVHRQYRDSVRSRIESLATAHRQTVEALAVAINAKDEVTHEHVLRVQTYAAGVARLLGCTEADIEALRAGALLHDIGKIAVPDYILHKPGKLTAEEFNRMKLHTVVGAQILSRVEFPFPVVPVVRHHHERWDGKGYPDGLRGEEIPLTARILSVVDCFDAVREDRQYRKGMTRDEAIQYILGGSGTLYDPNVVATFIAHLSEFEAEIEARRDCPLPTFGIEPTEQLSEAALGVAPAAGLAAEKDAPPALASFDDEERRALTHLAASLEACANEDEASAVFMERLAGVVPFEACALVRVNRESGECRVERATGRDGSRLAGHVIPPGAGVTGWVLMNRRALANTDPKLDLPPHIAPHFRDYRTLVSHPVIHGKELLGALTLYAASLDSYDEGRQQLLAASADLLARSLAGETQLSQTAPSQAARTPAAIESGLTH